MPIGKEEITERRQETLCPMCKGKLLCMDGELKISCLNTECGYKFESKRFDDESKIKTIGEVKETWA